MVDPLHRQHKCVGFMTSRKQRLETQMDIIESACVSVLKYINLAVTKETPGKIYKDMVTANTVPTQYRYPEPKERCAG